MARLQREGRLDAKRAIEWSARVDVLSFSTGVDAAFGISKALRSVLASMEENPSSSSSSSSSSTSSSSSAAAASLVSHVSASLLARRQVGVRRGAPSLQELTAPTMAGVHPLLSKLTCDETACYMIFRANDWYVPPTHPPTHPLLSKLTCDETACYMIFCANDW